MGKNIALKNQANLWGRQVSETTSNVLEPQRSDLFMVDLEQAATSMRRIAGIELAPMIPQFVRSVSFPDTKVRAEAFRRDSVPFNLPSWDEPVDSLRIVFIVDTYEATDKSVVVDLLDTWSALTRAGIGSRSAGYTAAGREGTFLLDANYSVQCRFDVNISLIRGIQADTRATMAQAVADLNSRYAAQEAAYVKALAENGDEALSLRPTPPAIPPYTDMLEHTKWVARNCWVSGYKLTDLTYQDSQLLQVEATFYPEAIERVTTLPISGSPVAA